jgi:hypothetical protein
MSENNDKNQNDLANSTENAFFEVDIPDPNALPPGKRNMIMPLVSLGLFLAHALRAPWFNKSLALGLFFLIASYTVFISRDLTIRTYLKKKAISTGKILGFLIIGTILPIWLAMLLIKYLG